MNPTQFLILILLATATAAAVQAALRARAGRAVKSLAARWDMNYSPTDRLRLGSRCAGHLPIPGASDVYVFDLIYGADRRVRRYLFTAEYGVGVATGHRRRRVIAFSEPMDRPATPAEEALRLTDAGLPIVEQYRRLHDTAG